MDWTRGNAVGHGSTATVYLATSTSSGDVSAVKSAELSQSNFLQSEQRILSSLSHPCIVGYKGFDVTTENGKIMYNLFMEYAGGGSLWDEIGRRGGRMKEPAVGFYTSGILRGLEYLHAQGLVHCDIKAKNILIGEDGPKISDFGCSKRVNSPAPIAGTPMFMAPETARGQEQGLAADVWAVGCTVIEMVTGRPPWDSSDNPVSVLYRVGYSGDLPEIPRCLSQKGKDFLGKCLKSDPSERWTASELLQHPFLGDLNGSEGIMEWCSDSPTSVLDKEMWSSLGNLRQGSSERWDDERIRRLSGFSEETRWESGDENWITVRGNGRVAVDGEDEVDFICGSTSDTRMRSRKLKVEMVKP